MNFINWPLRYKIAVPIALSVIASGMGVSLIFYKADQKVRKNVLPTMHAMENIRVYVGALHNECREYVLTVEEETLIEITEYYDAIDENIEILRRSPVSGLAHAVQVEDAKKRLKEKIDDIIALEKELTEWQAIVDSQYHQMAKLAAEYLDNGSLTPTRRVLVLNALHGVDLYYQEVREYVHFSSREGSDSKLDRAVTGQKKTFKGIKKKWKPHPETDHLWNQIEAFNKELGEGRFFGKKLSESLEELEEVELANTTLLKAALHTQEQEVQKVFETWLKQMVALITVNFLVVLFIIWQVARNTGNSLDSLLKGTQKFRADNLGYRVQIIQKDEIGALARSFNNMADQLEKNIELRMEAENELIRTERLAAIGQLTATVSHELRNPMGAIRTSLAVINKISAANEHPLLKNSLEIADRSIGRCDKIIEDLLGFTRIRKLNLRKVDCDAWLKGVLAEYSIPSDVTVQTSLNAPVLIEIDPDHFMRAILNILQNGIQAMEENEAPKAKFLIIESSVEQEAVRLIFSDTGCGIKPELMDKVFEPLYSNKSFGTGLGLPTVQQIVEVYGGKISLSSEWGKGVKVTINLPLGTAK